MRPYEGQGEESGFSRSANASLEMTEGRGRGLPQNEKRGEVPSPPTLSQGERELGRMEARAKPGGAGNRLSAR